MFILRQVSRVWNCCCDIAATHPFHIIFGWLTSGMSGPVTCRIPPAPQLSVRSCWSRNPEGTPHLGSFPSLACRPTWEGPVVLHTEPLTCASYHLADTIGRLLFLCHEEKLLKYDAMSSGILVNRLGSIVRRMRALKWDTTWVLFPMLWHRY